MKKLNFKQWLTSSKAAFGISFGLITLFLTFYSWDDFCINKCTRCLILFVVLIFCALYGLCIGLFKREVLVWKKSHGTIKVKYGDILKLADKKSKERKIIVIPVNTHFDTIVESPRSNPFPLVSENSIHGKWLIQYLKSKKLTAEKLQKEIYQQLNLLKIKPIQNDIDRRGGKKRYEIGTCLLLSGNDTTDFLLAAIAEYDINNKAQSNKDDIVSCIKSIIDFSDSHGQGRPCYIPLIGTGYSRAQLSHQDSLHILLSTMDLYNDRIHSEINVIIYKGDKDNVSIFDK